MLSLHNKQKRHKVFRYFMPPIFKVHLRHLQHITAISQEYIPTLTILCHILILALFKGFQLFRIITLYPASLIQAQRFPTTLRTVFILQAILDNCATPSSINWSIPLASCFCFIGSAFSIYLNISGEKLGKPRK